MGRTSETWLTLAAPGSFYIMKYVIRLRLYFLPPKDIIDVRILN